MRAISTVLARVVHEAGILLGAPQPIPADCTVAVDTVLRFRYAPALMLANVGQAGRTSRVGARALRVA